MTVPSEVNKIVHAGDGATAEFTTSFTFAADAEVTVTLVDDLTAAETLWTAGTEYTLTGANTGNAGVLTVDTSPSDYTPLTDESLVIELKPDFIQGTRLPRSGNVSPRDVLEPMHDNRVRQLLRLLDLVSRSIQIPLTETSIGDVPSVANRMNKFFRFDASGDPEAYDIALLDALTLPVDFTDGGTGASYANAAALLTGLGLRTAAAQDALVGSTVQPYSALTALLNTKQPWTNQQYYTPKTDDAQAAGVLTVDFDAAGAYREITLTAAVTTMTLNNMEPGGVYRIRFTGAFTITGWAADVVNDFTWPLDTEHVFGVTEYTEVTIMAGNTTNLISALDFGA